MKFLVEEALSDAIRRILAKPQACAAVAFWGKGSADWATGAGTRIITNLKMGGTNPAVMREIAKKQGIGESYWDIVRWRDAQDVKGIMSYNEERAVP